MSLAIRTFFVGSTVQGAEAGWEALKGFSAVGHLVSDSDDRTDKIMKVKTVRVDEVVGEQVVQFAKIDVQGTEHSVLRSSRKLLSAGRIRLIFIEFDGSPDIVNELIENDYELYDSEYLLVPLREDPDLGGWNIFKDMVLSTGRTAFRAWPKSQTNTLVEYLEWFAAERAKIGGLFNDLVAVHRSYAHEFEMAAERARVAAAAR